jgi:hypothetical protein
MGRDAGGEEGGMSRQVEGLKVKKAAVVRAMQSREAVGRFLGCEGTEVDRMIEMDALPVVRIPGEKRPRLRIFLPDFHEWLAKRTQGGRLRDYETFLNEWKRVASAE